jgi:hypothetical protein
MYVMLGVGASGVLFGTARFFARGKPATMTKEYQEASNEYLKVCINFGKGCSRNLAITRAQCRVEEGHDANHITHNRARRSSLSPVSPPRATSVSAWSRASQRANRCATFGIRANERNVVEYPVERAQPPPSWSEKGCREFPCVDCSRISVCGKAWEASFKLYLTHARSATVQRFFTDLEFLDRRLPPINFLMLLLRDS